ncbi:calcium-dependent protein kinase 6 [Selaginella moellendorffii]|uniref:calcium-dependent protein kinase 6 n=1 Tax=Selaginella moellendorffii TaxID=88036 RepID=UPI000D1C38B7|nr:calcium-dependent protein kinase 6 [Selaginella moellendorffii]|eukprot:XP_024538151.1 calcium-dependent protein kinase 6 [Selaginella moellendorffii]
MTKRACDTDLERASKIIDHWPRNSQLDDELWHKYPRLVERYTLQLRIGDGSQGVFQALRRSDGAAFAVKTIAHGRGREEARALTMASAIAGVIKLEEEIFEMVVGEMDDEVCHLVLELCSCSLTDMIKLKTRLGEKEAATVVYNVAVALDQVHDRGMIHCDIKPGNVLVKPASAGSSTPGAAVAAATNKYEIKLGDFGSCWPWSSDGIGTPGFMAPESVIAGSYSTASDVFGLGMVLYTCLSGMTPFYNLSYRRMMEVFARSDDKIQRELKWDCIPPLAADLIRCMIARSPEERFTLEQFFDHEWILGFFPDQ